MLLTLAANETTKALKKTVRAHLNAKHQEKEILALDVSSVRLLRKAAQCLKKGKILQVTYGIQLTIQQAIFATIQHISSTMTRASSSS